MATSRIVAAICLCLRRAKPCARRSRSLAEAITLPQEERMSLRDFNNTPASDDPIALHNEPLGNGGGLSTIHTTHPEEREPNRTPQIAGAVAVALLVGVA